jgi:hypothetical protein
LEHLNALQETRDIEVQRLTQEMAQQEFAHSQQMAAEEAK